MKKNKKNFNKKKILYVRNTMIKFYTYKNYVGKSVEFSFSFTNAINTFYSLNYDYWDLIIKCWSNSMKWKTCSPIIISFSFTLIDTVN